MKVVYIFRRPVANLLKDIKSGKQPSDTVYGLTKLPKRIEVVTHDSIYYSNKFLRALQIPITKLAVYFSGIGFSLIPVILELKQLRKARLIFSTVDTMGLPILFFKFLGLLKVPVIYNTIGLEENLQIKKNSVVRFFYSKLFNKADSIISVASSREVEKLASYLKIPKQRINFCPFGVDEKYFYKSRKHQEDYIISVGADPRRDWKLLLESSRGFDLPLKIVCQKNALTGLNIPENVEIIQDIPIKNVRELMEKARLVVIILKKSSYFSGQTTLFRAMSMGKAVIFTKIDPLIFYTDLIDGINFIQVRPNDKNHIIKEVNDILRQRSKLRSIENNARKFILSGYTVDHYSKLLADLFKKYE